MNRTVLGRNGGVPRPPQESNIQATSRTTPYAPRCWAGKRRLTRAHPPTHRPEEPQRVKVFPGMYGTLETLVGNTPGRSRGFAQNLTVPSMPSVPSLMELRLLHQEGDLLRVQVNSRVCSHLL